MAPKAAKKKAEASATSPAAAGADSAAVATPVSDVSDAAAAVDVAVTATAVAPTDVPFTTAADGVAQRNKQRLHRVLRQPASRVAPREWSTASSSDATTGAISDAFVKGLLASLTDSERADALAGKAYSTEQTRRRRFGDAPVGGDAAAAPKTEAPVAVVVAPEVIAKRAERFGAVELAVVPAAKKAATSSSSSAAPPIDVEALRKRNAARFGAADAAPKEEIVTVAPEVIEKRRSRFGSTQDAADATTGAKVIDPAAEEEARAAARRRLERFGGVDAGNAVVSGAVAEQRKARFGSIE